MTDPSKVALPNRRRGPLLALIFGCLVWASPRAEDVVLLATDPAAGRAAFSLSGEMIDLGVQEVLAESGWSLEAVKTSQVVLARRTHSGVERLTLHRGRPLALPGDTERQPRDTSLVGGGESR